MKVDAYIQRTQTGEYRIFCKRAKHKWWHELGKHPETDVAFERALNAGKVNWQTQIRENTIFFKKNR